MSEGKKILKSQSARKRSKHQESPDLRSNQGEQHCALTSLLGETCPLPRPFRAAIR